MSTSRLILGSSRAGKTSPDLLELARRGQGFFVRDPHGDLAAHVLAESIAELVDLADSELVLEAIAVLDRLAVAETDDDLRTHLEDAAYELVLYGFGFSGT